MKFTFNEQSEYGQRILELIAEVSELVDENREYQKHDVNSAMIRIKTLAEQIQREMKGRGKESYFGVIE